jgi:hypothetical protein
MNNIYTPGDKHLIRWLTTTLLLAGLLLTPLGAIAPPAQAQTFDVIVQAGDMVAAAATVRSVGGTVTHELAIIDAVGAQLTLEQSEALRALPGVRTYGNRSIQISQAGGTETVRDAFGVRAYGNNDGSQAWLGNWVEYW